VQSLKSFNSIIIAAIIIAGLIVCSYIFSDAMIKKNLPQDTIAITGSAKKQIRSDRVEWSAIFSAASVDMKEAYSKLIKDKVKVKDFLIKNGVVEKDIDFSSINTQTTCNNVKYADGSESCEFTGYSLSQTVNIKSDQVDQITKISKDSTELINEDVYFTSNSPFYYYSKLSDLKIEMIAEATKDSKRRVDQIVSNTGSSTGRLVSAKMGVFQITPLYSTEVTDEGINDTTSIDKEITAIVTCTFNID
jgi:hypothetical protein